MMDFRYVQCVVMAAMLFAGVGVAYADGANYATRLEAGEITPMGAMRAGNEAGTIPVWQCDADGTPPRIDVAPAAVDSVVYPAMDNPFAGERPRLVITADNYKQYADKLTAGTEKLIEQYPNSFRVPVYSTHRTACFSELVYEQTAINAKRAKLVHDGNGLSNAFMGVPFPIPKTGLEAIWNNMVFMSPYRENSYFDNITVFADGAREQGRLHTDVYTRYNDPSLTRDEFWQEGKTALQKFLQWAIKPARTRGTLTLGLQYMHKARNSSNVWQYFPGTRRVRRAPYYGYDTPTGAGGLRGVDDFRLFNGPPNRFNWRLVGKMAMFVPYNAYLMDADIQYSQLLGAKVLNPAYTRWELHRVWKVVATLKEGADHWYSKRVLYIDEDSGHALLADNYDRQGTLWRTGQQNYVWTPLSPHAMLARAAVFYDFNANAYNVQRLINERPQGQLPRINAGHPEDGYFTPSTLRRQGLR